MATDIPVDAQTLLIQFAKEPVAGQVKTRMIPALTPEQAVQLHCEMTQAVCAMLLESRLGPVQLAVAGNPAHALFKARLSEGAAECVAQEGADLGARMHHALHTGLTRYRKVVLVGSDCPEMDPGYVTQAVNALDEVPIVLGAASDGGYVLIGATQITREIFTGVNWGEAQVLAQTRANLYRSGTAFSILTPLQDIDRPEDLSAWEALAAGTATRTN